ncbi:MAG: hypothetical protein PHR47_03035 [Candidatus Pacebacteria bacterium]|nr:hypothetical protein [Candidatus Paceibacterota bacterium]
MLKKLSLILIIIVFASINFVYAIEENTESNQTINSKIISIWENDAKPFLKGLICSFKTDVWDKTNNWLEKNNIKKIEMPKNEEIQDENKKSCTFFEAIHKAFTGKESSTSK